MRPSSSRAFYASFMELFARALPRPTLGFRSLLEASAYCFENSFIFRSGFAFMSSVTLGYLSKLRQLTRARIAGNEGERIAGRFLDF